MPTDSPPCQCTAAGFCERWRREVRQVQVSACQANAAGYRDHWDALTAGKPSPVAVAAQDAAQRAEEAARPRPPCVHLGAELRRENCPTCAGNVQVKVFACAARGECTLAKPIDGIACCQGCGEYQAAGAG